MPRQVSEIRVVVASPMEMSHERKIVFECLKELNRHLDGQALSIKALGWEEYTTPGVDVYPQEVVNIQLLEEYDVLIGLFGTRLGTPTAKARSGTVEEIERALCATDSVMAQFRVHVYFLDRLESISSKSLIEMQEVAAYRDELKNRGVLFKTFRDGAELSSEIRVNIQRSINFYLKRLKSEERSPKGTNAGGVAATPVTEIQVELGSLDIMESSEKAIYEANAAVNSMAEIMAEITAEQERKTKEIEKLASPAISTSIKKKVINEFAEFLKAKASQLKQQAGHARNEFRAYFSAQRSMLELAMSEADQAEFWKDKDQVTQILQGFLSANSGSYDSVALYKKTLKSLPRMTIQFNQARRDLIEALDESIELSRENEKNINELMNEIDRLCPKAA